VILTRILELGDFRSGSITAIKGRCGKPNCRCHQPDQHGHGPNFRLTHKVNGKTVSGSFASAAEMRQARALRAICSSNSEVAQKIRTEFGKQHAFVGSGVIEADCKTVIRSRLKQLRMFWTVRGANAILALRCCHLNGRFEDYWETRQAA